MFESQADHPRIILLLLQADLPLAAASPFVGQSRVKVAKKVTKRCNIRILQLEPFHITQAYEYSAITFSILMAAHSSSTHQTDQYNLYGEEAHRRDYARILTNIGQLWTYPEDNSEIKHESQTCPIYRRIGAGHCGSVWTSDISSQVVLKRGDGAETRHLWKEYYMQTRLLEALAQIPRPEKKLSIHVPYCYWYTNESDTQWWSEQLARFPAGVQASTAMYSERILPVGQVMRETLIEKYCPERLRSEIKEDKKNEDCIIRLYLGRRRLHTRGSMFFSLRNFPLWLDQATEPDLQLPVLRYAETMAQSLAVMHWEAGLDAGDVEFVLGAPRSASQDQVELVPSSTIATLPYNSCTRWREPPEKTTTMTAPDTWCREPHLHAYEASEAKTMATALDLWLLDFDCCGLITMDAHGIEKAASTLYRNDPYYPRPCSPESPDFGIWEVFRKSYLECSKRILERKNLEVGLAEMFITRLIVLDGEPKEIRNAPVYNTGHDSNFL